MPDSEIRKWVGVGNTYLHIHAMKAGPCQTPVTIGMGMESSRYREEVLNWYRKTSKEGGATIQALAYLCKETHNKYARS